MSLIWCCIFSGSVTSWRPAMSMPEGWLLVAMSMIVRCLHSVKSIHKNFINKEVHRQVFHRQCNLSTRNSSTIVIYPQCNSSIWNLSTRNLSTIVIYPQCNLSIRNLSTRNLSTIVIYPQCTPSIENSSTENPSTGNSSTVEGLHCRWITLWIDYNCG